MSDEKVPSTFFSSTAQLGRLYGQGGDDECLFDLGRDKEGRPVLRVRPRTPAQQEFQLPYRAALLVQLFEQPDTLWLARATTLGGEAMILYAPLEPLESRDGRCDVMLLADVTLEQVDEALHDAMDARDRSRRSGSES